VPSVPLCFHMPCNSRCEDANSFLAIHNLCRFAFPFSTLQTADTRSGKFETQRHGDHRGDARTETPCPLCLCVFLSCTSFGTRFRQFKPKCLLVLTDGFFQPGPQNQTALSVFIRDHPWLRNHRRVPRPNSAQLTKSTGCPPYGWYPTHSPKQHPARRHCDSIPIQTGQGTTRNTPAAPGPQTATPAAIRVPSAAPRPKLQFRRNDIL
jgi:hypothetical protein